MKKNLLKERPLVGTLLCLALLLALSGCADVLDPDTSIPATGTEETAASGTDGANAPSTKAGDAGDTGAADNAAGSGDAGDTGAADNAAGSGTTGDTGVAAPVDISLWANEDSGILDSDAGGNAPTISRSGSGAPSGFTVSVTSAYTGIQWTLSGAPFAGNISSVVINAEDYVTANYILGVIVFKEGIPYSSDIRFTVIN
jgi:hypothetical protein